ncbi:UNVERIFIED_CONTAM: hypothetical protein PYX00_001859 [Menopon gallinae]|uniref:RING-type domain-containing protein n=1 Tax=Menopon gallinae TaxID=328185 RepID=A0AAW2IFR9_9NEOP
MVGNPYRWRAAIPQLENRNATAGCLLALILFIPFLWKIYHINISVLAFFVLVYVTIIVPVVTGIMSRKYLIGQVRKICALILDESKWNYYMTQLTYIASWLHFIYVQFEGVHVFMKQVIFNMAAEKVLCPEERLSCFYVLLFYSFIAYLQRSLQARPWAHLLHETSAKDFIKLTTAFIVVRLGKGVILSFVLLTFTIQFNHLEPSFEFVCLTLGYFILTQYQNSVAVNKFLIESVCRLQLECLDGMEEYWVPMVIQGLSVGLSAAVSLGLIYYTNNYITLILLGYVNIFVPVFHSLSGAIKELRRQRALISKYPLATCNNPQIRGGYPCAICLDKMRILSARCTPCGHAFHRSCLRRCLQHFSQCPLCKTHIR